VEGVLLNFRTQHERKQEVAVPRRNLAKSLTAPFPCASFTLKHWKWLRPFLRSHNENGVQYFQTGKFPAEQRLVNTNTTVLLKRILIFSELEETALFDLAQKCQRRLYKKNEAVFHEGDPGHTLYIVCAGRVNVQRENSDGKTALIARRGPGEHFGELALIDGKPRMADVIAAEPSELLMLRRDAFIQCIEQRPQIALKIMAALADRLREAADHLGNLQELDVLGRVAGALLERLQLGSTPEADGGRRLLPNVTQKQLAGEMGATRESVNRAIANLKDTNAVRMAGRALIILDEKRLRQIAAR